MSRTERRRSYNNFSGTPANLQAVFSFCENRPSERPRGEKSGWSLEGSAGAAFPAIRLVRPPLETLERLQLRGFLRSPHAIGSCLRLDQATNSALSSTRLQGQRRCAGVNDLSVRGSGVGFVCCNAATSLGEHTAMTSFSSATFLRWVGRELPFLRLDPRLNLVPNAAISAFLAQPFEPLNFSPDLRYLPQ